MSTLSSVLATLCPSPLVRQTAETLCYSSNMRSAHVLRDVLGRLGEAKRTSRFDYCQSIALCHQLCVAASPDRGAMWVEIVMLDLMHDAGDCYTLDTYSFGSQLGLFLAGCALQTQQKAILGGDFLRRMGAHSVAVMHSDCTCLFSPYNAEEAQKRLDKAVKVYLTPAEPTLAEQLNLEIAAMVTTMRDGLPTIAPSDHRSWLFNSLLSAIGINNQRSPHELVQAALAATSP